MQGEAQRASYIEEKVSELVEESAKMGLTPETRDLVDKFEECKQELILKVRELSILEVIAMESTDENIVELREQLFMAVKLIHSDDITGVMREISQREDGYTSDCKSTSPDVTSKPYNREKDEIEISKYDVIERIRKYLNKRAEFKKYMRLTRKPQ